jgi:hypothetical protein
VLLKAVDKEPEYAEAHFRLANVYELIAQVERSPEYRQKIREHYQKSVELKPGNPSFMAAYAILGTAYLGEGNYENARTYFEQFLALKPVKAAQVKEAQRMIANCDFALKAKQEPLPFPGRAHEPLGKPVRAAILPGAYRRPADGDLHGPRNGRPQERRRPVREHQEGRRLERTRNPLRPHQYARQRGTCTISADGRTLVFTSCEGRQNFGSCDLFVSYKVGDEWTEPVNLGNKINSVAWESQPSLSADGRTLYFVSDRRGTYGRRDIWKSLLGEDGYWGGPENMGPNVNTPEDDLSPFIHANSRTLYFSSKGHVGMGGYDLFSTEYQNGQWTFPKNLGYPLNNHDDQVSLFVTADGKKGYYAHEEKDGRRYLSSKLYEFNIPRADCRGGKQRLPEGPRVRRQNQEAARHQDRNLQREVGRARSPHQFRPAVGRLPGRAHRGHRVRAVRQ